MVQSIVETAFEASICPLRNLICFGWEWQWIYNQNTFRNALTTTRGVQWLATIGQLFWIDHRSKALSDFSINKRFVFKVRIQKSLQKNEIQKRLRFPRIMNPLPKIITQEHKTWSDWSKPISHNLSIRWIDCHYRRAEIHPSIFSLVITPEIARSLCNHCLCAKDYCSMW